MSSKTPAVAIGCDLALGLLFSLFATSGAAQTIDVWGSGGNSHSEETDLSVSSSPTRIPSASVGKTFEERLEGVADPAVMDLLLDWYGKAASKDPSFFFDAAREGNSRRLNTLLAYNAALAFATDAMGRTGLHWAAFGGHVNEVNKILTAGAVPNARDNQGDTPLDLALENGHQEMAHLLMRGRLRRQKSDGPIVEPNPTVIPENARKGVEQPSDFETSGAAAPTPPSELLPILPEKKTPTVPPGRQPEKVPTATVPPDSPLEPLEVPVEETGPPPEKAFRKAVIAGDLKRAESLLQQHPGLVHTYDTKLGWTPLHWAVERQHYDMVQLLLFRGANVNAREVHGWTPLRLARNSGNRRIFNLLLNYRATE